MLMAALTCLGHQMAMVPGIMEVCVWRTNVLWHVCVCVGGGESR